MRPRVSLVTLAVEDLDRAVAFYRDGLGLPTAGVMGTEFEIGAVAFFDLESGLKLAVWPRRSLAADTGLALPPPAPGSFALAHNVGSRAEVDDVMAQARRAGARIVKPAQTAFWGGYAGYFQDPDGHLWEVAWNPAWSAAAEAPAGDERPATPSATPTLRDATAADWPSIWALLEPTFRAGDTYSFARDIDEAQARTAWMDVPARTFVATRPDGEVVGTYYLKPNQPGGGSHVCNCGYVVGAQARGLGVASTMCEHSQQVARAMGFRAMQFNFVVSTNEGAVRLWQRLGFRIVGTLPGAFRHPTRGDVDAYVMHKPLPPD